MKRKSSFVVACIVAFVFLLLASNFSAVHAVPATNSTLPDFLEKILEAMYPNATSTELNQIRTQWANQLAIDQEHAPGAPEGLLEATPPTISVLSPLNQTYNNSSVPLIFTTDKAVNWMGYSFDGTQNVTITDNGTLTNMANGLHSITIYANDTIGNIGASQIINFTSAR